jgi:hypothetical protein
MSIALDTPINTMKEAWQYVGGLSNASKMPGYSYGIPAEKCKVGSKLRKKKNSVCSDCYALKGQYQFPNVKEAQEKRLKCIDKEYWVMAMAKVILAKQKNARKTDADYFRWHDAGDIQSVDHLKKIIEVVKLTPSVEHWLPTREVGMVLNFLDEGNTVPDNMIIRISAMFIGQEPVLHPLFKDVPGIAYSAVGLDREGVTQCEAYTRGGECGPCRLCWEDTDEIISYPQH